MCFFLNIFTVRITSCLVLHLNSSSKIEKQSSPFYLFVSSSPLFRCCSPPPFLFLYSKVSHQSDSRSLVVQHAATEWRLDLSSINLKRENKKGGGGERIRKLVLYFYTHARIITHKSLFFSLSFYSWFFWLPSNGRRYLGKAANPQRVFL